MNIKNQLISLSIAVILLLLVSTNVFANDLEFVQTDALSILPANYLAESSNDTSNISLSAEYLLSSVATGYKNQRTLSGKISTGCGVLFILMGSSLETDSEFTESLNLFYLLGAINIGVGVWQLNSKTQAELEYEKIEEIQDANQKENAAYNSLVYLSAKARNERLINGIISAAAGLYYLSSNESDSFLQDMDLNFGILFETAALCSFIFKSPDEIALEKYEKSKADQQNKATTQNVALQLGLASPNNLMIGLKYRF